MTRRVVLAGVIVVTALVAVFAAMASSRGEAKKQPAPARANVLQDDDANLMRRLQRPKLTETTR